MQKYSTHPEPQDVTYNTLLEHSTQNTNSQIQCSELQNAPQHIIGGSLESP